MYGGEFADGRPKGRGRGRETLKDGLVYEGESADGKRHGRGRMTLKDGRVYEGECADGRPHGWGGKMTPKDGTV